ncbi:hypothetical protein A2U01_0093935, partial [Trifolium medium]|nr:hypothetical protein [Trifolium medium]
SEAVKPLKPSEVLKVFYPLRQNSL